MYTYPVGMPMPISNFISVLGTTHVLSPDNAFLTNATTTTANATIVTTTTIATLPESY